MVNLTDNRDYKAHKLQEIRCAKDHNMGTFKDKSEVAA
jgi:hypothetical protein